MALLCVVIQFVWNSKKTTQRSNMQHTRVCTHTAMANSYFWRLPLIVLIYSFILVLITRLFWPHPALWLAFWANFEAFWAIILVLLWHDASSESNCNRNFQGQPLAWNCLVLALCTYINMCSSLKGGRLDTKSYSPIPTFTFTWVSILYFAAL